jgi:hypothetical protein
VPAEKVKAPARSKAASTKKVPEKPAAKKAPAAKPPVTAPIVKAAPHPAMSSVPPYFGANDESE